MTDRELSVSTEILYTANLDLHPCEVTCHSGFCETDLFRCSILDDVPNVLAKMSDADAVILGAPRYFRGPPAGFHALIERMISMAFFHESAGGSREESPLAGTPCGLIGVAEYSDPQFILEYLHDACQLLGIRPVALSKFPYLGVGAHGDVETDDVFQPFERARDLASQLLQAVAASS
jgi:NAD(P)H-dependent FMN reductase